MFIYSTSKHSRNNPGFKTLFHPAAPMGWAARASIPSGSSKRF